MCGIVGYVGDVSPLIFRRLIEESMIRGQKTVNLAMGVLCAWGIAHCRYPTSGITPQPIKKDSRTLIFNGVIDGGTKEEMETRFGVSLEGDNDGEVLLAKCSSKEEYLEFIRNPEVSFAGILLDGPKFFAFRNKARPLWMNYSQPGCVYFASTKDIFDRAGLSGAVSLEPYNIYEWTI